MLEPKMTSLAYRFSSNCEDEVICCVGCGRYWKAGGEKLVHIEGTSRCGKFHHGTFLGERPCEYSISKGVMGPISPFQYLTGAY